MKKILIINNQAFGDMMLGTHAARVLRDYYKNTFITFVIRGGSTLTTNESGDIKEITEILELQYGIDRVRTYSGCFKAICRETPYNNQIDGVYLQNEWFSDLGIAKSMLSHIIVKNPEIPINTETEFRLGIEKKKEKLIITAGHLDWERKVGFFPKRLIETIEESYVLPVALGKDTFSGSYLEALKILLPAELYIGPIGSMAHIAAGLGIDTISVCSVFPVKYDSPEFYHSGYHRSIKTNIQDDYSMILPKTFNPETVQLGWGNPPVLKGFWDYKNTEFYSTIEDNLIKEFNKWKQ